MYLVREDDILRWCAQNELEFIRCACRVTANTSCDSGESKRAEIKALLRDLRQVSPAIDMNIFRSVENVNLRTVISYHLGEEYHHFLDDYDARGKAQDA
ncbi:MAG: tRNA 2-thiocytidine biosynthesis protein TtcA, partial [Oscillospiraceae bacterium]|nr:tRNA 2-thiocytidine biosynthesis protein TtcA [Oscillospiraceae bacterium]